MFWISIDATRGFYFQCLKLSPSTGIARHIVADLTVNIAILVLFLEINLSDAMAARPISNHG